MSAFLLTLSLLVPDLQDEEPERKALIVATTGPPAIHSGLESMREGGTAADAVLTTALSQIVLAAGSWVSFAGRMTMVYYEAETGDVHSMNANSDAPREETDPRSIPRAPTPSGRTVLVPGFMAGVEAMHRRLGRRPFSELFEPAIQLAEDGFVLDRGLAGLMARKRDVLSRLPETRAVFTREDGEFYREGDRFRQPRLAETLRRVAVEGAAFMATGEWGQRFVAAVRAEGGRLSPEDLAEYRVRWEPPFETEFHGVRIVGLSPPNRGGPMSMMGLNLLDEARLSAHGGHYTTSAASLVTVLRVEQALGVLWSDRGREALAAHLPGVDLSPRGRWSRPTAREVWKVMNTEVWDEILGDRGPPGPGSEHSDSVVAVDRFGNVAAILHTINTGGWGATGIFVDGVSIPDSGAAQQGALEQAGPGGRVVDHGPPLMALREGRPVLACSATGSGNFTATWQNVLNVLEFGMSPAAASRTPNVYGGRIEAGAFPPGVVESARAIHDRLEVVARHASSQRGYWVGVRIDPRTGRCEGGKVPVLDGVVMSED